MANYFTGSPYWNHIHNSSPWFVTQRAKRYNSIKGNKKKTKCKS